MMDVLPAIATETLERLFELIDLFIYAVFHFFGEDQVGSALPV